LKEWFESIANVCLDFGESDHNGNPVMWLLGPKEPTGERHIHLFSASAFVRLHNEGDFELKFTEYMSAVRDALSARSRSLTSSQLAAYERKYRARRTWRNPRL
jgi:hypothetical protein